MLSTPPPSPIPVDWGIAPCLDLINSRWTDHLGFGKFFDRLPEAKFRRAFLKRWRFKVDDPDDRIALADLRRLRGVLRSALERYGSGRRLTTQLREQIESAMNRAPMHLQVQSLQSGVLLHQRRSGRQWDIVLAEIATSAVRLMSERRTVKICANPNCSWMFVDESRPGTRRWCNTGVCGSLFNVRRYRVAHANERRKAKATRP